MGDRIHVPLELDDFDVVGSDLVEGVLEVMVTSTFPKGVFSLRVDRRGGSRPISAPAPRSFLWVPDRPGLGSTQVRMSGLWTDFTSTAPRNVRS